ncbi:MAG TPA: AI-2E family transporter [Solirubrobacteraceae bacterium]|jgi:predicted PurR-regulated permease PerM|nr:AI-2E family transporter [Solirubrobacteraceae bacterium]
MATVRDEPRATEEPRIGRKLKPRPRGDASREIRIPRLLVAGSEIGWRFIVCIAALALIVYGITRVSFAFIPVFLALLLATLLVPPARWLQRRGAPPALAAFAVFFSALVLFAGLMALLGPPVVNEFGTIGDRVREGADKLGTYLADSPLHLDERDVQREIDRIDDRLRENSSAVTSGVLSGAAVVGELLAGLLIMLVVLFFFVKDGPGIWNWVVRLFPERRRPAVEHAGSEAWQALTHYVRGVVTVATVDAVGIGLALWIIGVPLVFPLAILTFFTAFVPIVGSIAAGAVCALVALVHGGPVDALLVVGATVLVQQLEGNVLYPMIVGRRMELHPIAILLAVTIGGITAGVVGAAIAVPIAAMGAVAIKVARDETAGGEMPVETVNC